MTKQVSTRVQFTVGNSQVSARLMLLWQKAEVEVVVVCSGGVELDVDMRAEGGGVSERIVKSWICALLCDKSK